MSRFCPHFLQNSNTSFLLPKSYPNGHLLWREQVRQSCGQSARQMVRVVESNLNDMVERTGDDTSADMKHVRHHTQDAQVCDFRKVRRQPTTCPGVSLPLSPAWRGARIGLSSVAWSTHSFCSNCIPSTLRKLEERLRVFAEIG